MVKSTPSPASRPHPATLLFMLILLAFIVTYGWMAWAGNRAFMRILFDTDVWMWHSVMKHALRGEFPLIRNPYSGTFTHYFAADHFNPLLFLVLPFWLLWPSNALFAWVQIAVYGAAAVLLWAIARIRLQSAVWAALLAAVFLLTPSPNWSLYNHFSSSPFLTLFLPGAVWCLLRDKTAWYWVAVAGLLLSREDAALLATVVGLYAILVRRRSWLGWTTVLVAVAYFLVVVGAIMPALAGGFPYPYTTRGYVWLGPTPAAAVRRLLTEPLWVLQQLYERGAIRGLILHLLPFAFTPLASWRGLLFLLPLTYLLLHPHSTTLIIHHAYWAAILSGLAAVEGVRQLRGSLLPRLPGRTGEAALAGMILALAVGTHVWAGYSPISRAFNAREFTAGPRERAMRAALALVPSGSQVSASRIYLTHLAPTHTVECVWEWIEVREGATPAGLWCTDWDRPLESEYLLLVEPRDSPKMGQLLASEQYGVRFLQHDVVLLQRDSPTSSNQGLARWVFNTRLAQDLPREIGRVVFDDRGVAGSAVKAHRGTAGLALYGWYRWLCPGPHQVVLRARTGAGVEDVGQLEIVSEAGATVVGSRPLPAGELRGDTYKDIRLPFVLTEKREIEVRVRKSGLTELWLDTVSLDPFDTRPHPEKPPC